MKRPLILAACLLLACPVSGQEKKSKVGLTGEMGAWYEGYGLDKNPATSTPDIYAPRRPWNLVRYVFRPALRVGKWTVPFDMNFSLSQNNFVTAIAGGKQSLWQVLSNPANNFGLSPKIGNAEFLLGTQTLQYSDLSTGDLGIFGYGVNFSPGKFRLKVFNGVSQRPVNYLSPTDFPPNGIDGAYQRNQWMAQAGMGKEGRYFAGFNIVKSTDKRQSVSAPPLPPLTPQENLVVTFLTDVTAENGWNYHAELGQSFHTRNLNSPLAIGPVEDAEPLLNARTSTGKGNAVMLALSRKKEAWQAGIKFNYVGVGYYTAGYPFLNNDRLELLSDTRFSAWKKKMAVTASAGQRFGNLSHLAGPKVTRQLLANVNVFTQFDPHLSLNTSFNNFGFNAIGTTGYKSVSNEITVNPAYTWADSTMNHLLSITYTQSKYTETTVVPSAITHNATRTAMLVYVPTFLHSKFNPDLNLVWFRNAGPTATLQLMSAAAGMTWKAAQHLGLKAQLQYSLSTLKPFTSNKNLLATAGFDWQLYAKLTWQLSATANVYRYGTELPGSSLVPAYPGDPHYVASTVRTGLSYKF